MRPLTLAELRDYDPRGLNIGNGNTRYLCPITDECCDKPRDNGHRTLTVRSDGVFHCFRCGASGFLGESVAPTRKRNRLKEVMA